MPQVIRAIRESNGPRNLSWHDNDGRAARLGACREFRTFQSWLVIVGCA